ncbi:hypothetical protein JMJ35_009028 [Cladonia borealis]|uniref:NACHT domain-containing protein n=1 Tax=Cladonia borealis TaxID=184061 RepID=A0AA39UYN8_9LECA|nr:hypothetical protein JMJ35_009028 [Cladonia borealis]
MGPSKRFNLGFRRAKDLNLWSEEQLEGMRSMPRHPPSPSPEPMLGLRLLYDGAITEEARARECDVDIVAVHGLNGGPLSSFTDASTGCCWLQQLLPVDFPHCRVYSYGYDAALISSRPTSTMYDIANGLGHALLSRRDQDPIRSPLIFVGHSLGGLLIKRLLVTAMNVKGFESILEKTSGILFFGTPHQGTSKASWLDTTDRLLRVASIGKVGMNKDLIDQLKSVDGQAQQVRQQFVRVVAPLKIFTFYEQIESRRVGIVVERSSAILGVPNEEVISLHAVHKDLCKFSDEHSPNYQKVSRALRVLYRYASEERRSVEGIPAPLTGSLQNPSGWMPNIVSKTGKTAVGLLEMAGSMEDPQDFSHADVDIVAIHGLGGSPIRSWINNAASTLWLRDFLQADFPTAHITSYGYNAESALRGNTLDLSLLASDLLENIINGRSGSIEQELRPIVFIGYSFGGLVLKKALLLLREAVDSPTHRKLYSVLAHIIFLGVPHESEESDIINRWTRIIQCTAGIKRFDAFNIGPTIEQISLVTKDFRHLENVYAGSIAESEPTRTFRLKDKSILVSARSVRLGWGDRETIFVARDRNHLELPSFVDSEDPTYIYIRDIVGKVFSRLGLGQETEESKACVFALQHAHLPQSRTFELIPSSVPGRCEWILDVAQMRDWLRNKRRHLIIEGLPGVGKTVLAKYLVQKLPTALEWESLTVLHFFFRFGVEAKSDEMFASLLYQLFRTNPSLIRHAIGDFRLMGGDFASSSSVLSKIFSSAVREYTGQQLIIILDGLDECRPLSNLLQLLDELQGCNSLKLLMTTRTTPELNHLRDLENTANIVWASSFPSSEIFRLFTRQELDGMPDTVPPIEREKFEDLMIKKAAGSFLWVRLVIDELKRTAFSQEMLSDNFTSSTSANLFSFYNRIFEHRHEEMSDYDWKILLEILSILLVIVKPVSVELVVRVLNAKIVHTTRGHEEDLEILLEGYPVRYVQQKIIEPLPIFNVDSSSGLDFVHGSVKNYLCSSDVALCLSQSMSSITEGHLTMAAKCVTQIRLALNSENALDLAENPRFTFTRYAAINWVHHLFESQELLEDPLKTSVYDLFRVSDGSSPQSRWLHLYEEANAEVLPDHKIFGPLFGGAYFGLRPIVQMALEIGADTKAQDERGRTALHWASERGHLEIVDMLLACGVDLENRNYGGWTALHVAAQQGHKEVISLLLANGADVNIEAADGRRPVQVSMEAGQVDVVRELLNAGADVTQGSYSGSTVVQLAEATDEMLKTLMESSTATTELLGRSLFDNNCGTLSLLFQWRPETVIQEYPWVGELLREDVTEAEVLDLLLKSENLDWVPSEEIPVRNKEKWTRNSNFQHHRRCAHNLKSFSIDFNGKLVQSTSQNEMAREVASSTHEDGRSTSTSDDIGSKDSSETNSTHSTSTFLDPNQRLDQLERREQALISFVGIGGVFPPEQFAANRKLNPGFAEMRRHVAQILYGDRPIGPFMSIDVPRDIPALQYEYTRQAEAQYDSVSLYSTSTNASRESESSYNSETCDDNYELWDQSCAHKIREAFENILSGMRYLHTEGGCCDCYTVLVKSSQRDQVIEVKTITASTLQELCTGLEEFCDASDSKPMGWTGLLTGMCLAVFDDIGYGGMASDFLMQSLGSGKTPSPTRCLHICALIAQIASVSLVTYSRGHSREFYTLCLTRPIDCFILGGLEDYGPSFCAERVNLACMGNMLGRKVWIFHRDKKALGTFKEPFLLSTNIENLLDTWGGRISIQTGDEESDICVYTGGGSITSAQHDEAESDLIVDNEVFCHWISDLRRPPFEEYPISRHAQLLIGATSVNDACSLKATTCQKSIANSLVPLGTRPPCWRTTGRTAGIGFSHWFNVNMSMSQARDDGRSLKKLLIDGFQASKSPRLLNSPWGLELSLCTGIARRVRLRHLVYGEVLKYLELGLPGEWHLIADIVAAVSEKSDDDFEQLLKDLTKEQSEVLTKATELLIIAMESTGVDSDGHTLTLWWPERNEPTPRGIKFLKTQYSGENPWIAMIKDSEHCAVFGLATTRCLQRDDVKICRHTDLDLHNLSPVQNIMLDTTLTPAESELSSLSYSKGSRYLLWEQTAILRVTRARQDVQSAAADVVRLTYSPGKTLPPIAVHRLKLLGRLEKVKEKSGWSDPGQGVLIL